MAHALGRGPLHRIPDPSKPGAYFAKRRVEEASPAAVTGSDFMRPSQRKALWQALPFFFRWVDGSIGPGMWSETCLQFLSTDKRVEA